MSRVREGYKMTELGEIPAEWDIKSINDLFETIDGDRGKNYPNSSDFSHQGYCLFLDTGNVTKRGFNFDEVKFINEEKHNALNAGMLKRNDFVLTSRGTIGNIVLYDDKIPYNIIRINSAMLILRSKYNEMDLNYILQVLKGDILKKFIAKSKVGSAQPHITKKEFNKMLMILPPFYEQQKIASILTTVDEQIDQTEQLIVKTKELKKGLMQQLLTKGIGHTEFKQSELGEIPVDWEIVHLENLTNGIGDGIHSTPKYSDIGEIPFVNGNNITNSKLVINNNTKMIDEEEYSKFKSKIDSNAVLLSINGTIGNVGLYDNEKVLLGKSIAYINPSDKIQRKFLFYQLQSAYIMNYFTLELTGTTIKNLSLKTIRNTRILLPSLEEQQKIASILSTVDEQIERYEEEKAKYEELKKGLMQQLLTGEIRVKVD